MRAGTNFTGYYGADGVNWTLLGNTGVAMATTVRAGLEVTAHNNSALCVASFDNLTVLPTPPPAPSLSLNPNAGQLVLSWPGWASSYAAYAASNLLFPIQWQMLTNIPQTNNGTFNLEVHPFGDQQYFRLGPP